MLLSFSKLWTCFIFRNQEHMYFLLNIVSTSVQLPKTYFCGYNGFQSPMDNLRLLYIYIYKSLQHHRYSCLYGLNCKYIFCFVACSKSLRKKRPQQRVNIKSIHWLHWFFSNSLSQVPFEAVWEIFSKLENNCLMCNVMHWSKVASVKIIEQITTYVSPLVMNVCLVDFQ